jgi:hypothetical protein
MRTYLNATGRAPVARAAYKAASMGFLNADEGAEYDEVIEIVRSSFIQRTRYLIRIYRICPNLNQLSTVLSLLI